MTRHVLVVEDSPTQCHFLREVLQEAGYAVTTAASGKEALSALADCGDVDLVLTDVVMPGMDGFELCQRLKEDPSTATIPVMLLTSLRDPLDVVRALEVGADYFFHKPYEPDKLLSRIRTTLDNVELRGQTRSRMALELSFLGRQFTIDAQRQQLLDLLVTTFEDLVETNKRLRVNEERLTETQERLADQLRAADLEHRHLAALLESMPDAVFISDVNGRVTGGNRTAVEFTGLELRALIGQRLADALPLLDRRGASLEPAANPLENPRVAEKRQGLRAAVHAGQRLPVSVRTAAVHDRNGDAVAAIAVVRDVSAETFTDPLTGLPTRALLLDRLERTVLRHRRTGGLVGLVLLALGRLDVVTDSYGAAARDQVVAEIATRLRVQLGEHDTLGHLGDDEFAVIPESVADSGELLRLADRLTRSLHEPFHLSGAAVALRANAGVALAAAREADASTLLQQAGGAVRRAQARGERSMMFDPRLQEEGQASLELEADLTGALGRRELVVHYQPEVELGSGKAIGAEALVRWLHPRRGLLSPGAFIEVSEETGLIVPMGMWVLREACRRASEWNAARGDGRRPLFVSVNLSARQLEDPDLVPEVVAALDDTGLPAPALMLEVTETAVMRDPERAASRLGMLKDLGVRLALDDFGTGHSSLAYLRRYPFDVLKVDRSFVQELPACEATAIVGATISLGRAFGMMVIAEGVETEEQRRCLAELGCPAAAGYLFHRPLATEAVEAALA